MHASVERVEPAPEAVPDRRGRAVFAAAAVGVPLALALGFSQISWFWNGLGWAGLGMIVLIGVMAVYVIGTMSRLGASREARKHIRELEEALADVRKAAQIPYEMAEAMWCENQRDQLLEKHRGLGGYVWEKTIRAYKDPHITAPDCWTPAAEELALWARHHLPALYTEDDIEKPAPQQAPHEAEIPEPRRMEYRTLNWRKQMMERYVCAIAAKLDSRASELRASIAEAGNPLTRECPDRAGDRPFRE